MILSLSRRFLALLLAWGLLAAAPASAYDSDYEDSAQEVKKTKKKKKFKKKLDDDDDYWDESTWNNDEVEPVVKKKKKKSKKKNVEEENDDDSWDSWDADDDASGTVTAEDAEDFFSDDEPTRQAPQADSPKKATPGSAVKKEEAPAPAPQVQQQQSETKSVIASRPGSRDECVRMLRKGTCDYVEFKAEHPQWTSPVRVNKEHRVLLALHLNRGVATVLELNERELVVKWDAFAEERFLRQADGTYKQTAMVKRSGEAMPRKARRVAARLRSRKAVDWEDYGWSDRFIDWISGDDPPLTYKTVRLVNESMDCKARFSEDERVLVKMGDDNQAAWVLGYTGVKLHVRWENGSVDTFKRLEDGSYRKINDELVARQLLDPDKSTHEKSEDNWLQLWWRDVMNEEKPLSYVSVEMQKGEQVYHPRISMDNHVLMQTPPHKGWAKVVKFDHKQLIIRWNGSQEELYERRNDNVYHHVLR